MQTVADPNALPVDKLGGLIVVDSNGVAVVQNSMKRGPILYEYRINVVVDPQSMVGWRSAQNGTFTLRVQGVP